MTKEETARFINKRLSELRAARIEPNIVQLSHYSVNYSENEEANGFPCWVTNVNDMVTYCMCVIVEFQIIDCSFKNPENNPNIEL